MAPLETAIQDLRQILGADLGSPDWRWNVRRRLSAVKDALADPQTMMADAGLSAREGTSNRHRRQLQARVTALAAGVLERLDVETIAAELRRLQGDLERHVQRVHDLAYDAVSLELGGSE
jgi:hypothetical protein